MKAMSTQADELMRQALADPQAALRAGESLLAEMDPMSHRDRSDVLRAMSMAARHVNDLDTSIQLARRSIEAATAGASTESRLQSLLTMSGSLAITGQVDEALAAIEEGLHDAREPDLRARFEFQHAAVLDNAGRVSEAREAYRLVLPIFRDLGDQLGVQMTLNRLGRVLTALGLLSEAEACLSEALELSEERGELASAHGIQHNLGLLASYRGDIPLALEWLQKSDDLYMKTSGADSPQHVARAEVLISVGLYEEALSLARTIARSAASRDDVEHEANALVVAARAALMGGLFDEATEHAESAAAIAQSAALAPRHAVADVIRIEARLGRSGASDQLLKDAEAVALRLADEGLVVAAAQASFLCARIAEELGELRRTRTHLERVAAIGSGPVEARVQAALARARLRLQGDEKAKAMPAIRSGLAAIDRYQATLGATDLRFGIERQGTELARFGLQLAHESGRPRRILEWLDRTRARALRYQPVVPTSDDEVAGALARLRRVEAELRRTENRDDRALNLQRQRLQEEIVRADRVRRETRAIDDVFSIGALFESLGTRTLLEFGEHDGRLFAVGVRRGRARLIELGDAEETTRELSHLRFAMRRGARRRRPVDVDALHRLDQMLFGTQDLGDEVVVVPPPSLIAAPWAGLPSLRGRSLQVSPSAEMWWRAQRHERAGDSVVVAGGPDLELARHEVEAIGKLHSNATVLPPGVSVDEVRSALSGSSIAHIATHATFQVQNPMFSSLRLGDGDLNVYDIERLNSPPAVVVLSACDSGYTESRAGEELAGLTSAFLTMGSRSVVASVGLVPDANATSDLMVDFHRGLVDGLDPARALSRAQSAMLEDPERFVSAASFICAGA
jgi:tetratricopeptide (TPR) repeat protein